MIGCEHRVKLHQRAKLFAVSLDVHFRYPKITCIGEPQWFRRVKPIPKPIELAFDAKLSLSALQGGRCHLKK